MKPLFLFIFFIFLNSCFVETAPNREGELIFPRDGFNTAAPSLDERIPKRPDPAKQNECRKRGTLDPCGDDDDCSDLCDEFFGGSDREDCEKLPQDTVEGYEILLENIEKGDVKGLDTDILTCMLDIDLDEFIDAIVEMDPAEARLFLTTIADEDDLAKTLYDEDNDSRDIIRRILYEATGADDLSSHLRDPVNYDDDEDDKSFFWIAAEGQEWAWRYFDSYVYSQCNKRNRSTQCYSGDRIEVYCRALLNYDDDTLKDFLDDASNFENKYERRVKRTDGYSYNLRDITDSNINGNFRDWCNNIIDEAGNTLPAQKCPDTLRGIPSENILTRITFEDGRFIQGPHCKNGADPTSDNYPESENQANNAQDSPGQATILNLQRGHWKSGPRYGYLVLDANKISYDPTRTYYLYIGSKRKMHLDEPDSYSPYREHSNCDYQRRLVVFQDFAKSSNFGVGDQPIVLASEKDNECQFHTTR